MTVSDFMRRSAALYRDREAVVCGDRRLTYGEAWERGLRLAGWLRGLGLQPGDRVGVLEDNGIEAVDLIVGATVAGLVRVPLYAGADRALHAHMLAHTGCRVVLADARHAAALDGLDEELDRLEAMLVRDAGYEPALRSHPAVDPAVPARPGDLHLIRHTGGTTGLPKGVPYTHRTWLAACRGWFFGLPPLALGDRCLNVSPIAHGSGYFFTPTWLAGGCNVLLDRFDAAACVELLEREEIAFTFLVPGMLDAIVGEAPPPRAWPHLKAVAVAGAAVPAELALAARELLGPVLYQAFGQSEGVPATFMGPEEWFGEVAGSYPLRSAGRPAPFADVEIRGPGNEPLRAGAVGEIAIRCDGQMDGYWQDAARTAEALVDGWVLTGDCGRMDGNGFLYVLGRRADRIRTSAGEVWPAALEDAIRAHPSIVEVGVFGEPDGQGAEHAVAVCVVRPGTSVGADEIAAQRVLVVGERLPRTPVGKLERRALRTAHGGRA